MTRDQRRDHRPPVERQFFSTVLPGSSAHSPSDVCTSNASAREIDEVLGGGLLQHFQVREQREIRWGAARARTVSGDSPGATSRAAKSGEPSHRSGTLRAGTFAPGGRTWPAPRRSSRPRTRGTGGRRARRPCARSLQADPGDVVLAAPVRQPEILIDSASGDRPARW